MHYVDRQENFNFPFLEKKRGEKQEEKENKETKAPEDKCLHFATIFDDFAVYQRILNTCAAAPPHDGILWEHMHPQRVGRSMTKGVFVFSNSVFCKRKREPTHFQPALLLLRKTKSHPVQQAFPAL